MFERDTLDCHDVEAHIQVGQVIVGQPDAGCVSDTSLLTLINRCCSSAERV